MRCVVLLPTLLALPALLTMTVSVQAAYLGNVAPDKPIDTSVYLPPAELPRQGGNTIAEAIPITIPGAYTGTTVGYTNNYTEACPYGNSTAPDVVYRVDPTSNILVDIDLCHSSYDTKVYVYDQNLNLVDCNDDFYFAAPCFVYSSKLEAVPMSAGVAYYIVIDGYGSAAGTYHLDLAVHVPCVVTCPYPAQLEYEPPLVDGYSDAHNGGCNSPQHGSPFQALVGPTFCGVSGWYYGYGETRDTDWFHAFIPFGGVLTITGDAEYPTYMFELAPQDCGDVAVVQTVTIGPCSEATMYITGVPGTLVWFWVGPTTFTGPVNEYNYTLAIDVGGHGWPSSQVIVDPRPQDVNAPWELVKPSGEVISGQGYTTISNAPNGTYTLTWLDAPGCTVPFPATASGEIVSMYWETLLLTGHYSAALPYSTDFPSGPPPFFQVVTGSWAVSDGWYRCNNTSAPGSRHLSTIGNRHWTGYRVDVDIHCEGTPDRELAFRYQAPDSYYRYVVLPHPVNLAQIWTITPGQATLLHEQAIGAVSAQATLRLGIRAHGNVFRAYLDGVELFEVVDPESTWLDGGIALSSFRSASGGPQIASFDNLEIVPLPDFLVHVDPWPRDLDAPWQLAGPDGGVVYGSGQTSLPATAGQYTLTWMPVVDWQLPQPPAASGLVHGIGWQILEFQAAYGLGLPHLADFDDGLARHFTVISGHWAVSDGWYRCLNNVTGTRRTTMIGSGHWTNYRVAVDAMAQGSPEREILFRYQSPDDHYRYLLKPHPENTAWIFKRVGGQEMPLQAGWAGIVDGSQPLRLGIEADGSTLRAFFNDSLVFEIDDPVDPLLAGGVVLCALASAPSGWQQASFDNLVIEPLGVVSDAPMPEVTTLSLAAVPNPFNPMTVVRFEMPSAGDATIAVHDLRGRLVRKLHRGEVAAGRHELSWDGRDDGGGAVASGVYLVRIEAADGEVRAVKVTLAR